MAWSEGILSALHRLQQEGLYCDTTLVATNRDSLRVHSCVLAAAGPTFHEQLQHRCSEYILNLDLPFFELVQLVKCLYTGVVDAEAQNSSEVLRSIISTLWREPQYGRQDFIISKPQSEELPEEEANEQGNRVQERREEVEQNTKDDLSLKVGKLHHDEHRTDNDNKTSETRGETQNSCCGLLSSEAKPVPLQGQLFNRSPENQVSVAIQTDTVYILPAVTKEEATVDFHDQHDELVPVQTDDPEVEGTSDITENYSYSDDEAVTDPKRSRSNKPKSQKADDETWKPGKTSKQKKKGKTKAKMKTKLKRESLSKKEREQQRAVARTCSVCGKEFRSVWHKTRHELIHTGVKPYQCTYCDRSFSRLTNKNKHEELHQGKASPSLQCCFCSKMFKEQADLLNHEQNHRDGEDDPNDKPEDTDRNKDHRFKCSICDKAFSKNWHRIRHEKSHTDERPYRCSYCDKAFSRDSHRIRHENLHTGKITYQCRYCGQMFKHESLLYNHEKMHSPDEAYECSYCDKKFAWKSVLVIHERSHTGEKPFQCMICGKGFTTRAVMVGHEKAHQGEFAYHCSYCPARFIRKSNVVEHERIHTGEKPFKCAICEKSFRTQSGKIEHERTHEEFNNEEAQGNPYVSKMANIQPGMPGYDLKQNKIGRGRRPKIHECEHCGKRWEKLSQKIRHERLHTGDRPYKCGVCNKAFMELGHKKRHEKRHLQILAEPALPGEQQKDALTSGVETQQEEIRALQYNELTSALHGLQQAQQQERRQQQQQQQQQQRQQQQRQQQQQQQQQHSKPLSWVYRTPLCSG